jgi:hypothetical protein
VLELNNEYSLLNSKSVKYRVAVLEASDAKSESNDANANARQR